MKTFLTIFLFTALYSNHLRAANTLLFNGKIYPEVGSTTNDWIFLKNNRVHSFGKGPAPTFDPDAEKIDLKGRVILPSITDAHSHITDIGREKFQISLHGTKSAEEAVERIRASLKNKSIASPNPIVGNGWDQSDWPDKKYPTRELLDAVSDSQPIVLYRIDGHAAWVNTYALQHSTLWKETSDPQGGKIHRGKDGFPNGILVDRALKPLDVFEEKETDSQLEEYILAAVREAQSLGITGIHDAGANGRSIETMRKLLKKKKISFRFYEMLSLGDKANYDKYLASGPELDSEDGQLTVRSVKFYADGAMGSRGAAFREPYNDDPKNKGLLRMNEEEMVEAFKKADQAGFQIAIHTIGSLANHIAINAMEKALGPKIQMKRPRLEHAQVLDKADFIRIGKLGIVASMQPTHCSSDMKWVTDRIGKKRARYAYAWASVLKAKAPLAFGSDAPIELLNPWHGLFSALTRQNASLEPKEGFYPEERLSFMEAYRAFTTGAAYASHSELLQGKLSAGAWADFIVLEKEPWSLPPLDLRKVQVLETWIGGQKVYQQVPQS